MARANDNKPKVPVAASEYGHLRVEVLMRDNWKCQLCGAMMNLDIHHRQFRSHGGPNELGNLITLCRDCHEAQHGHRRCTNP